MIMLYRLFENFRGYIEEDLLSAVAKPGPGGTKIITPNTLTKIFKYFHLSSEQLAGDKPFTFTPRIPTGPYADHDGNTTEDDFTNRISLAPSIEKALEALELPASGRKGMHVYAIDFVEIKDDDLPTVNLSARIKKCPKTADASYGPDFRIKDWLEDQPDDELAKIPTAKRGALAPSKLPPKWRNQFYGCVPDAARTKELWAVQPVKMYYLGQLDGIINTVLSKDGMLVLQRYLEKLSAMDDEEEI